MRRRVGLVATLGLMLTLVAPGTPVAAADVGSATLVPMQVTGPAAQRLNLIVMGDGYTEAEQDKFRADVDRNLNVMWSVEPFSAYRNYINVYALEIISGESGVRCDPDEAGGPDPDKPDAAADDLPAGLRRPTRPWHGLQQRHDARHERSGRTQHSPRAGYADRQPAAQHVSPELRCAGAGHPVQRPEFCRRWRSSTRSPTAASAAPRRPPRVAARRVRSSRSTSWATRSAQWPMSIRTARATSSSRATRVASRAASTTPSARRRRT